MTKDELFAIVDETTYGSNRRQKIKDAVEAYSKALLQQAGVSRSAASILDQVKVKCRIENGSIIIDLSA